MLVALDVGGSSVKAGLVDGRTLVGEVTITPLDHRAGADRLVDRFVTAIESVAACDKLAIALPDPFDHVSGTSRMQHKFVSLYGLPLVEILRGRLGGETDIRTCNDAAAAAVGEAVAGAGCRHRRVLGITLGTGLGAAFTVDGQVIETCAGIVPGDLYRERVGSTTADDLFSARALFEQLTTVDDRTAAAANFGRDLAKFLTPFVSMLQADVLVIGGGGLASFDLFAPALRAGLPVPTEAAELDRSAPLIGAGSICFG